MVSLKDLKAPDDDDGSFDRMVAEIAEITSDEKEQLRLLTERVVKEFINSFSKKAKKETTNINRVASCEKKKLKKLKQISDTEEAKEEEEEEEGKKKLPFEGDEKSTEADMAKKLKKRAKTVDMNIEELGLDQSPCIPTDLGNHIESKGIKISDLKLLIVKQLSYTDLSEQHVGFTMPVNEVKSEEFLTPEEKTLVDDGESIDVIFIDPTLEETTMRLKKRHAISGLSYELNSGWKWVQRNINKIHKINDIIQIRWFRLDGQLWFTFSKIERGEDDSGTSPSEEMGSNS